MQVMRISQTIPTNFINRSNKFYNNNPVLKNMSTNYSDEISFTGNAIPAYVLELSNISKYQNQIREARGDGSGFNGVNELRQQLKTKLSKYDNGLEVYNIVDSYYLDYLRDSVIPEICVREEMDFWGHSVKKGNPNYYTEGELGTFMAYSLKNPQDRNYLEYIKSKYGPEAVYSGQASAICAFETLNYLLDKPVLADAVMNSTFQAMDIFGWAFRHMTTGEFFDMPSRYKDAFTRVVDYLSSDEGSKILSNKEFCKGLYLVLGDLASTTNFRFDSKDHSEARIERIKRAAEDPECLYELCTPEWQKNMKNMAVVRPYYAWEKEEILDFLKQHRYTPDTIKNIYVEERNGKRIAQIRKYTQLGTTSESDLFELKGEKS